MEIYYKVDAFLLHSRNDDNYLLRPRSGGKGAGPAADDRRGAAEREHEGSGSGTVREDEGGAREAVRFSSRVSNHPSTLTTSVLTRHSLPNDGCERPAFTAL